MIILNMITIAILFNNNHTNGNAHNNNASNNINVNNDML